MDPFSEETPQTESVSEMPLLMARDVYEFVDRVKSVYYDRDKWNQFSVAGSEHVRHWFGKREAALELDGILGAVMAASEGLRSAPKFQTPNVS